MVATVDLERITAEGPNAAERALAAHSSEKLIFTHAKVPDDLAEITWSVYDAIMDSAHTDVGALCMASAAMVQGLARKRGHDAEICECDFRGAVGGERKRGNHWVVLVDRTWILDPTVEQFGPGERCLACLRADRPDVYQRLGRITPELDREQLRGIFQDLIDDEKWTLVTRETVRSWLEPLGLHALLPAAKKLSRNNPCPCGSGLKAKKCCHQ